MGGDLTIDKSLAEQAIETHLCSTLNMSVTEAALGIIRVINSNMALAIRANSVARGIDPREYALMPFGGAGPLHGLALADSVAAREVIVPPAPGITAAIGLLATDIQYEFTRGSMLLIGSASDADLAQIDTALEALVAEASAALSADGTEPDKQSFSRIAECRYQGQGFELRANIPDGAINKENIEKLALNFHSAHEKDYGHAFTDTPVEVITLRVVGSAPADKIHWPKLETDNDGSSANENPQAAYLYTRTTVFDSGQSHDTPRYAREKLLAGQTVSGPAIIIQHNSTSLVPPNYTARVSELGNLHITAA